MAAQPRADSCAPYGTPHAGRPRRSRNASATNAQPEPPTNELLSSVPPKPSTAAAAHRATRLYGEAGPAAPGAGARLPARWTFSPNSTKPSASPPRKRATIGTRAAVMHSDDPGHNPGRPRVPESDREDGGQP